MQNNKNTSVIIKTALVALTVFLLISAIMGLFNIFSFRQMVNAQIRVPGYYDDLMIEEELAQKFMGKTVVLLMEAFAVLFLFLFNALHLISIFGNADASSKIGNVVAASICSACMLIAVGLCIFATSQAFTFIDEVPHLDHFPESIYYYEYTYFQSYQSCALSTFVPMLIAAVIAAAANIVAVVSNAVKLKGTQSDEVPSDGASNQ
ncbi:MAG: hypothetical protein J1F39_02265 [Clostridiales bacterium]|nr:hypothetical protein [Clostridiales bacterium]